MNATTSFKFMQQLCEQLRCADKTAQNVIEKENKRQKQNYYHKIRYTQLVVGDMVLLKRMAFKGTHKIQHHAEWQAYVELSFFRIDPVAGDGKVKIVH